MLNFRTAFLISCLLLLFAGTPYRSAVAQGDPISKRQEVLEVVQPDKQAYAHRVIEVVWKVNKSKDEPAPSSTVNIVLLSTIDGQRVETALSSQTANDGRELVSIPTGVGEELRIRVSTVDGTAAGVSPNVFKIESAGRSIFVVRHAEKRTGDDPSLTESGQRRAKKLAAILKPLGITHVYSTEFKRTLETALPTAEENRLVIQKYAKLNQLKAWIDQTPVDAKILIVGHSNTVGPTSKLFGGESIKIGESDYDDIVAISYEPRESQFKRFKFDPEPLFTDTKEPAPVSGDGSDKKGP